MQTLHQLDKNNLDLWTRYDAALEHELSLFVPTGEALRRLRAEVSGLLSDLGLIGATTQPGTIPAVHGAQLREAAEGLQVRLEDDPTFPNRYAQKISGRLGSLLGLDRREAPERATAMQALLQQAPDVLAAAAQLAGRAGQDRRELFLHALGSLGGQLEKLPGQLQGAMPGIDAGVLNSLAGEAANTAARVRALTDDVKAMPLPAASDALRPLSYEETLLRVYGIRLADLVAWHREEVERCDAEFRALTQELGLGRDPFDILVEDSPPYPEPDMMYTAIAGFLKVARDNALRYITLPQGEACEVKQVPEHLRDSYPWGGYWGGNTLRGETLGAVFLNRYNYREVTRAWIQMNAVHESYPGHHAHAVKTAAADMPMSFKLGALTSRGAPLSEGVAHRSETLLKDVFGEPAYPLFVLYRRLHTAVRIWVDLELFHLGGGVEAGVALYRKYLGFADQVARGQVLSQRLTPGYFTVYYYGMRDLERLQKEIGWEDRPFTELIFSSGKVSLKILRQLLKLGDENRTALTAGYSTVKYEE